MTGRSLSSLFAGLFSLTVIVSFPLDGHAQAEEGDTMAVTGPKLENLLRADLEGVEGTEVIVSRVTVPPNSSLPKHWHPGEEFAYVLEGTVVLQLEGEEEIISTAGQVAKIPLKTTHSARTNDEGATVLVFRVHETGEPERHLVE